MKNTEAFREALGTKEVWRTGTSARTRTGREAGEAGDGAASDPATSLEERRAATRWVDQTVDTDTDLGTRVIGCCIQSSNAFNRTSCAVTRVGCGAAMSAAADERRPYGCRAKWRSAKSRYWAQS